MNRWQLKLTIRSFNLYIVLDDRYVYGIYWSKQSMPISDIASLNQSVKNHFRNVESELILYFENRKKSFTLNFLLEGTSFQKKVWNELLKIPYGKTISYGELATNIDLPGGSRAVGNANSKNPISIVIPCHRVVRSDGNIGGYAGGTAVKQKLLEVELGNTELDLSYLSFGS